MSGKPGVFRRLADKAAVEAEPGLTTAQLMVRNPTFT
jgi:NCS1 family nucleobase:cation symporter-1